MQPQTIKERYEEIERDKSNEEHRHGLAMKVVKQRLLELQHDCKHPADKLKAVGFDLHTAMCTDCGVLL